MKIQVLSWDYSFLGARNRTSEADEEQPGDSPVLVMHDGVTESIFCSFDSRKRSSLPELYEGGEDDRQRFGHFGLAESGVSE